MSLTDRDKKIALVLLPLMLLVGYWFLILSPQRAEVSKLDEQQVAAESARDQSVNNAQQLQQSQNDYASDYATVVRLGKAIPSSLDMPSLLVQLESAAKGTGIDFDSITVGQRTSGATATTTSGGSTASGGSTPAGGSTAGAAPAAPVDAGGDKAKTSAGQNTEKANDAAATANERNQAGGADAPAAQGSGTSSTATSPVAGLDTVPLNFSFEGSYFDLADFFHRVKRFVRVASGDIKVKGRLMTVDGLNLTTKSFPNITAEVTATIYLSPKTEGTTGGATSQGPAATPASSSSAPATPPATSSGSGSSSSTAPAQSSGETPQ